MPRAGAAGAFRYDLYIMEYIPKRRLLVESGRRAGAAFFIRRGITFSTLSRLRGQRQHYLSQDK